MQNFNYHLDKATPKFVWSVVIGLIASAAYWASNGSLLRSITLFFGFSIVTYVLYLCRAAYSMLNDLTETKARSEWEQSLIRTQQIMAAVESEDDINLSIPFANKRDELVREGIIRGWISVGNTR